MAQLRDSIVDGNLDVTGDIVLRTNKNGVKTIHPETGDVSSLIHMSANGNTIVGYDGYINQNGDSHLCGNDIKHYVGSADIDYRPYYRAGDSIGFAVRTSGFVTNSGTQVVFTVPLTKPIIGAPSASVSKSNGFVLRQNGYTHGSSASVAAHPTSFQIDSNYNSGFIVTATFDVTTNVTRPALQRRYRRKKDGRSTFCRPFVIS